MRVGRNPNHFQKREFEHPRVTAATITHIPALAGYHAQSLEILRLSLWSMRRHTDEDIELLVFDNGSCSEVRNFLSHEAELGNVDYLFLSKNNLGKMGALNIIFASAPGEIVAFSDGDVFFKPGWLEAHLELLDAFPNVGMVTGLPIRQQVNVFTQKGLESAMLDAHIEIESGDFLSDEIMRVYCTGVNRDFDDYKVQINDIQDIRLRLDNKCAFLGATHFQFVAPKSSLQKVLPLPTDLLLGSDVADTKTTEAVFDKRIEDQKLLRLSTTEVYVHHLGNRLTDEWRPWLLRSQTDKNIVRKSSRRKLTWLELRIAGSRLKPLLLKLYDYLFRLIIERK